MKSIKTKILTVVISGLLIITAIVSVIAVEMTHEVMHRDADRILNNVCQKEAAQINDVLGDITKSASIAVHYAITEIKDADDLENKTARNTYLAKMESMLIEIALNTNGIEGFYIRLDPSVSDGTSGFYKMIINGSLKDMPLTDLNQFGKDDIQNVGWYYTAVNAREGVWLEPYYFPGHSNQLISYVSPIYIQNELVGVVGFDMDFSYLIKRIQNINVYESGYAVLISKDGQTQYNKVEHEESANPHTKANSQLNNGMLLELRADYKDIQHDIHPMLSKIVFAFIIVLICSIIYTIVVTNRIIRPLKQLTSAAETMALGVNETDLKEIPIESKDEVGTLSRVLTSAYAKIKEYTTYINALAYRDSLTGIKNSTAYTEAIAELNKDICCGNPKFGVVVADINNLKQTNDKYGHDVGNDLIIHTAKILTDIFKDSTIFRIGGDEFAIILKGDDYSNYHTLLGCMDEACSKDFVTVCDKKVAVSVARGVALFDPVIDRVYEDVFAKADQAMYMHKEESKVAFV